MSSSKGTAFLCKLMSVDFDTHKITLRAWNNMNPLKSGFYVLVAQDEWTELNGRAASVDRSPEGGDPAEGLHAKHESAVRDSADAQPQSGPSQ